MTKKNKTLGLLGFLQLVFITLKLIDVIKWGWFIVLLPLIINISIVVVISEIVIIYQIIEYNKYKVKNKKDKRMRETIGIEELMISLIFKK